LDGLTLTACSQAPNINPWQDDALSRDTWSTPTQDGILAPATPPSFGSEHAAD